MANGRRETRIVRWYLETIKERQATAGPLDGLQAWADLEHKFVAIAASFSLRHGIKGPRGVKWASTPQCSTARRSPSKRLQPKAP